MAGGLRAKQSLSPAAITAYSQEQLSITKRSLQNTKSITTTTANTMTYVVDTGFTYQVSK